MDDYYITIEKREPNPEYAKYVDRYGNRGSNYEPIPPTLLPIKHLEVSLTQDEFEAIKKAVIEVM